MATLASAQPAEAGQRQSRLRRLSIFLSPLLPLPAHKLPPSPSVPNDLQVSKSPDRGASVSSLPSPAPSPARAPPSPPREPKSPPRPSTSTARLSKPAPVPRPSTYIDPDEPLAVQKRRSSLLVIPGFGGDSQNRAVSTPALSRSSMLVPDAAEKQQKRGSWLPGRSRNSNRCSTMADLDDGAGAWVLTPTGGKIDYSLTPLTKSDKVGELWDENGDTLVYLFPRSTGKGPSFKIKSLQISASQPLLDLLETTTAYGHGRSHKGSQGSQGSVGSQESLESLSHIVSPEGVEEPPEIMPVSLTDISHLYFPINYESLGLTELSDEDLQRILDVRNLFAFLAAQPIVCTKEQPKYYHVFTAISQILTKFDFANFDYSSFGEQAADCFGFFIKDLKLSDVRNSPEKAIEGLVMAERMKSKQLYHEAFTHAAGKFAEIQKISHKHALYSEISQFTRGRLERASQDLQIRQKTSEFALTDFNFPSLFTGIANSTSGAEAKVVRFAKWKTHYVSFHSHMLRWYKDTYGQWPPKANSKKHMLVEGGLNRIVLQSLYADFCALYDFLADRDSLTNRSMDAPSQEQDGGSVDPYVNAMRKLLSEFDRSSPPVNPPIPFDVPKIPTMGSIDPKFIGESPKKQHKASTRKLKENEYKLILAKSHNLEADTNSTFLQMYKNFEDKEAHGGKSAQDLADQRMGYWIFIYAVLQSLPMLVMDAEDLSHIEGVEYFLCQSPIGRLPWVDASNVNMSWFQVQGGAGYVSMPSDIVDKGTEGVYRRSHCWVVAERWLAGAELNAPADPYSEPLPPPPTFGDDGRPQSRGRPSSQNSLSVPRTNSRQSQRNSIALGLERLPVDGNWSPVGGPSRNGSPMRLDSRDGRVSGQGGPYRHASTPSGETWMSGSMYGNGSFVEEGKGRTFDDILGPGVEVGKKGRKK